MTGPAVLLLIAAILGGLGAFWASHREEAEKTRSVQARAEFERELRKRSDDQMESQRQLRQKSDEIAALNQAIAQAQTDLAKKQGELRDKAEEQIGVQRELKKKSDEIAELSKLLAAKSDEIASLNRSAVSYSKGEGSYCYFEPNIFSSHNAVFPTLVNVGKNPLYDLRVRIVPNPHKFFPPVEGKITYEIFEEIMRTEMHINVGSLAPSNVEGTGYPSLILKWDLPVDEDKVAYNVFFSARNDYFIQYLRFWRVKERWFVASKVVRQLGGEEGIVLHQFIQAGYPKNSEGNIDWDWTRS